jgi:hypothetical protein
LLLRVSDPEHDEYGKYMTNAEVHAMLAPLPEATHSVKSWLESEGADLGDERVVRSTPNEDWIAFSTTVGHAERLLDTEYHVFKHTGGAMLMRANKPYSLPEQVGKHVDLVAPTGNFPEPRYTYKSQDHTDLETTLDESVDSRQSAPAGRVLCEINVDDDENTNTMNAPKWTMHPSVSTGDSIRSLYSMGDTHSKQKKRAKEGVFKCWKDGSPKGQAVANFLEEVTNTDTDLQIYWHKYFQKGADWNGPVFGRKMKTGQDVAKVGSVEAQMDLELILATGAGIQTQVWGTSGRSPDTPTTQPDGEKNEVCGVRSICYTAGLFP